jgi:hypothetical protein
MPACFNNREENGVGDAAFTTGERILRKSTGSLAIVFPVGSAILSSQAAAATLLSVENNGYRCDSNYSEGMDFAVARLRIGKGQHPSGTGCSRFRTVCDIRLPKCPLRIPVYGY